MPKQTASLVTAQSLQTFYGQHPYLQASPFTHRGGADTRLLDQMLGRLGIDLAGHRVLDIGCGKGDLASYCLARGATYLGLDLVLQSSDATAGTGATFMIADGQNLPLQSTSVDVILCVDVFEHLPDQEAAVREFQRVLRPSGHVFLSVPNYSNICGLVKLIEEGRGHVPKNTWAPFVGWHPQEFEQFMTPWRVRRLFAGAGFRKLQLMGYSLELLIGLFPWAWQHNDPHNLVLRLQYWRKSQALWATISRLLPYLSLHSFWRITK